VGSIDRSCVRRASCG